MSGLVLCLLNRIELLRRQGLEAEALLSPGSPRHKPQNLSCKPSSLPSTTMELPWLVWLGSRLDTQDLLLLRQGPCRLLVFALRHTYKHMHMRVRPL